MAASVQARVKEIVCEQLGVSAEEVTPEASFIEDLGADSLDIVELVMALEEEYEMEISDEDAEKIKTVQDVITYIEAIARISGSRERIQRLVDRPERSPQNSTQIAGEWRFRPTLLRFSLSTRLRSGEIRHGYGIMIAFGCDHGGVELKDFLVDCLRTEGVDVQRLRHPGRIRRLSRIMRVKFARRVASGEAERGVLICTSGIGMSIAANKFPGVRAALVQDLDGARSSREHNDANILVLSGAKTDKSLARQIVEDLARDAVRRRTASAPGG